jgi:membrane-associated protein
VITASSVSWLLHPDMHGVLDRGTPVFLLIVGVIVFAESGLLVGMFLPGDSLLFSAGLVVGITGHPHIGLLVLTAFVAAVAGDQVGYGIGTKAGSTALRRPDGRFVKRKHIEAGQDFFEHHGARAVVLARFIPVVRTVTPVLAGVGGMRYRTFVTWNVLGAGLWASLATTLGYGLGKRFPGIESYLTPVLLIVVAASLLPMIVAFARQRRTVIDLVVEDTTSVVSDECPRSSEPND